jgi:hypothetical protein
MDHSDRSDFGLHEQVEEAVQKGLLQEGTRAHGIAQQVVHQGFTSLSADQRRFYYREVVPALNEMARWQYVRERNLCARRRARR